MLAVGAVVRPLPVTVALVAVVVDVRVIVPSAVAGAAGTTAFIEAVAPGGVVIVLLSAFLWRCFPESKIFSIVSESIAWPTFNRSR